MAGSREGQMGSELRDSAGRTEAEFLAQYRTIDYPKAEPTADAVVFHLVNEPMGRLRAESESDGAQQAVPPSDADTRNLAISAEPSGAETAQAAASRGDRALEVLLVRRGGHPFLGCWAVPGGFVNPDEDADAACARELQEETGLEGVPFEQLGFYSTPGRDPRGWVVSSAYVALVAGDAVPHAGDDAADARWFSIGEVPVSADVAAKADGAPCHELRIANGEEELSIAFAEVPQPFSAPRARIIASRGLAFDHDRVIADAWLRAGGR